MANSELIDSMIATYRNLNMTVRPLSDAQADQAAGGGKTLREIAKTVGSDMKTIKGWLADK